MWMHHVFRLAVAVIPSVSLLLSSHPSHADAVEDFYKGKTVRVIVGFPAGGGYDLYARQVAEFMGRFIPGRPTVIVQNMVGGGGVVAAKYMFEAAPRDGTTLGIVTQSLPLEVALQIEKFAIDLSSLSFVGRMASSVELGHGMPGAKFATFEDARRRELVVGASGSSDIGFLIAASLNKFAGSRFKIVTGYRAATEARLAAERGEIDVVPSGGLATMMATRPEWITERKIPILYQAALKRHALLPDVATLQELALSEEGNTVLRLVASTGEIGRSVHAPPKVPSDRLAALRKAFLAMIHDSEFKSTMERRKIEIDPAPGEAIDAIVLDTLNTPRPLLDQLAALIKR